MRYLGKGNKVVKLCILSQKWETKNLTSPEFHSVEGKRVGRWAEICDLVRRWLFSPVFNSFSPVFDSFHLFLQALPAANQDSRCKMIPAAFPRQKSVTVKRVGHVRSRVCKQGLTSEKRDGIPFWSEEAPGEHSNLSLKHLSPFNWGSPGVQPG